MGTPQKPTQKNKHENSFLQSCYNKYQQANFLILENCSLEYLNNRESFWAAQINRDVLLNLRSVGTNVPMCKEYKEKMAEMLTKRNKNPEFIKKVKAGLKGITRSEETRQKLREARKRQAPITDETRAKLSLSGKAAYLKDDGTRRKLSRIKALENIKNSTKIKPEQFSSIFSLLLQGNSSATIAKMFKVSVGAINNVRYGKREELQGKGYLYHKEHNLIEPL